MITFSFDFLKNKRTRIHTNRDHFIWRLIYSLKTPGLNCIFSLLLLLPSFSFAIFYYYYDLEKMLFIFLSPAFFASFAGFFFLFNCSFLIRMLTVKRTAKKLWK